MPTTALNRNGQPYLRTSEIPEGWWVMLADGQFLCPTCIKDCAHQIDDADPTSRHDEQWGVIGICAHKAPPPNEKLVINSPADKGCENPTCAQCGTIPLLSDKYKPSHVGK